MLFQKLSPEPPNFDDRPIVGEAWATGLEAMASNQPNSDGSNLVAMASNLECHESGVRCVLEETCEGGC